MKKLLLLLITLTTLTNVSYASFPIIADTLETTIDTLQTEEIKQYHSSLIKMGIDLNACKCESCRAGNTILNNNKSFNSNAKSVFILAGIFMITAVISLVRVIIGASGSSSLILGIPSPFFWILILGLGSILLFIKALLMQHKFNKNKSR